MRSRERHRTPSPGMSAFVSLDLARRRHLGCACSHCAGDKGCAGTERSSLLHARLGGAASDCIATTMDGTKGAASYEPVSHAPAVTDYFSVKSLRCCASMPLS
ncbi:hypothetical protein GQ55_6G087800 [Panicum hallii var. hallii]|uniref:Uncharacterized protein n=1 Tax=Panicum hallii var. hallii TaxID=1504633 RepID=A0A2T7D5D1_9POAL|nr:hypothetical protein GQ55_6G087800 [Panicum hallii var. hallii]